MHWTDDANKLNVQQKKTKNNKKGSKQTKVLTSNQSNLCVFLYGIEIRCALAAISKYMTEITNVPFDPFMDHACNYRNKYRMVETLHGWTVMTHKQSLRFSPGSCYVRMRDTNIFAVCNVHGLCECIRAPINILLQLCLAQ